MNKGFKSKVYKVGGVLLFIYLAYAVFKIGYQNWQFNNIAKQLHQEISILETENNNLKNKILYYQTDAYKERVARERLGYKKPGEEVLAIIPSKEAEEKKEEPTPEASNPKKWWDFFFAKKTS